VQAVGVDVRLRDSDDRESQAVVVEPENTQVSVHTTPLTCDEVTIVTVDVVVPPVLEMACWMVPLLKPELSKQLHAEANTRGA